MQITVIKALEPQIEEKYENNEAWQDVTGSYKKEECID